MPTNLLLLLPLHHSPVFVVQEYRSSIAEGREHTMSYINPRDSNIATGLLLTFHKAQFED